MITTPKQYLSKSFEELVNSLNWFDNPQKVRAIFSKLFTTVAENAPKTYVYKALLNKTNTTDPQVGTEIENTLTDDIQVNLSHASGDFFSEISISGASPSNVFVPLYLHQEVGSGSFDDYASMYRYDDGDTVVIRITYSAEDFQILNNFPFSFEVKK